MERRLLALGLPLLIGVPAEFIQPRTEYKVEVLAIEVGGNQTHTESTFRSSS